MSNGPKHPGMSRRSWPVRKYRLGAEPSEDLSGSTTAEERIEMMWPLAVEAWTLAGRPLPDYARDQAPVRRVRRGTRGGIVNDDVRDPAGSE
jgi:hypothetical protein